MNADDKNRNQRTEKTIKQKIASAQMRLNRLKTKEKSLSKSAETRLKIILGAEVAKALSCKVEDVDKEFVLGMLLQASKINAEAKTRIKLREKKFLEDIVGALLPVCLQVSPEILRQRLENRGRENASEINARLARAARYTPQDCHTLNNDGSLRQSVDTLLTLIHQKEKHHACL